MSVPRGVLASNSTGTKLVVITPNDTTDLRTLGIRAIYVGGGGDVAVRAYADGAAQTFKDVPGGAILPVCPARVLLTGTTATSLLGLI